MTGPRFSISPALAAKPTPVTLRMPGGGEFAARAFLTDSCGHRVPGAFVSVHGLTATPHVPAGLHQTVYLDWQVSSAHPKPGAGGRVSLILASRQGKASACKTGPSPYAGTAQHHAVQAQQSAATTPAASGMSAVLVGALAGAALLAVVAAFLLGRRRARPGNR